MFGLLQRLQKAYGMLNEVGPFGLPAPAAIRDPKAIPGALMDTAHGAARGMSADFLGAPVDMMAQLMTAPRMLGAPTPDFRNNPFGGSAHIGGMLEQRGLLRPSTGTANETAGRFIGGLLNSPQVVGRVGQATENVAAKALANAMVPNRMSPQAGAIVWHGSPHKFDKFDSSKIGTGEGAQAYGHGLYLAENPGVAKSYATGPTKFGGGFIPSRYPKKNLYLDGQYVRELDSKTAEGVALKAMEQSATGKSVPEKIEALKKMGRPDAAQWLERNASRVSLQEGALYKVDLPDEQIAKMLDWDKPLSQQPESVRKALQPYIERQKALTADSRWGDLGDPAKYEQGTTGHQLYRQLHEQFIRSGKALPAAEKERLMVKELRKAGIPGIGYLDGGSRASGQGTRNYVVFPGNEGLLKILERQ
jgi:hypothetical protein